MIKFIFFLIGMLLGILGTEVFTILVLDSLCDEDIDIHER